MLDSMQPSAACHLSPSPVLHEIVFAGFFSRSSTCPSPIVSSSGAKATSAALDAENSACRRDHSAWRESSSASCRS